MPRYNRLTGCGDAVRGVPGRSVGRCVCVCVCVCASMGQKISDQLEVNALQQRPHVLHKQLEYVPQRRTQRAHVIRNGIQHTHHQMSVIPLEMYVVAAANAAAVGIAGAAILVLVLVLVPVVVPVAVLMIRFDRIAAIGALHAAMRPGHRLLELVQMRQILIGIEQRMINIGAALVAPHGQVAEAQDQRMLGPSAMLLHVLIDVATAADALAAQAYPILHR